MQRLRLAVQKSGRLYDGSLDLLKECGIKLTNGRDQLRLGVSNFPLDILFLRNGDIPKYLQDGVADAAIIGENVLIEKQSDAEILEQLGFSRCRLSIATPRHIEYSDIKYLNAKRIATSYPLTLEKYLNDNGIEASIHSISGSVEIAPNIGLADAVCDIVSSGSTLFKNGLEERECILKSEAVLASAPQLSGERRDILDKLLFRMQSVLRARSHKYVLMNVPNSKIREVSSILPVLKSPTVLPLAMEGWSSLHSVIEENKFWDIIDRLKSAGAEDILIIPIDKMVI